MSKMLPALPSGFGNLRDVLRSAMQSVAGQKNALNLVPVEGAIVILVDGLGWYNFRDHSGHAPFLKKVEQKKLYSAFPSTTSASLRSIATGLSPSEHGTIGYRVFDRVANESVNFLSGLDASNANRYSGVPLLSQQTQVPIHVVTKPEYVGSGFSTLTFPDAEHFSASDLEQRFEIAFDLLRSSKKSVVYLYVPELDQTAHKFGSESQNWLRQLEVVNSLASKFFPLAAKRSGIVLTADHGIVDVSEERHLFLDECELLIDKLIDCAGDPRANFLYLKSDETLELAALNDWLAGRAVAIDFAEAVNLGLYSEAAQSHAAIAPDVIVLPARKWASYHREFSKPASQKMIGQHGGIHEEELAVPLFLAGAYSSSLLVP